MDKHLVQNDTMTQFKSYIFTKHLLEDLSNGTLVVKDLTFQYVQRENGFLSRV